MNSSGHSDHPELPHGLQASRTGHRVLPSWQWESPALGAKCSIGVVQNEGHRAKIMVLNFIYGVKYLLIAERFKLGYRNTPEANASVHFSAHTG